MQNLKESPTKPTNKQVIRLYPSLPGTNRAEVCLPVGNAGAPPETRHVDFPADTQSEMPVSTYERMKTEIFLLEEQNKELLTINKKWAKEYRTMEQFYREKVQHLKVLQHNGHSDEEKRDKEERHVVFFPKEEKVKADRQSGGDEADELRAQNITLTRRWRHQQEEIRRLNKALDEALLTSQQPSGSSKMPQDIWKHQAELYKEDFSRERKDREKLKAKHLELENQYKKVHSELNVLKSQVKVTRPVHCCSCTNPAKYSNWEVVDQPRT